MIRIIFGHPLTVLIGGEGNYIALGGKSTTSGPPHVPLAHSYEPYWMQGEVDHRPPQPVPGPGKPRIP